MKNNNWISFAKERPKIGDKIDLMLDDQTEWRHNPYGKLTSITNIKELGSNHCVVMDKYSENAWTMNSDKFIGSVVKGVYFWRLSD